MENILNEAYKGNYYTIIGCGGDLNEWKEGYAQLLKKKKRNWHYSPLDRVYGQI